MPPPEVARIDAVCDAVVAAIAAAWEPVAPDQVSAPDVPDLETENMRGRGRQVYVLPGPYTGNPATRASDSNEYTVYVLVAELYPDGGVPEPDWRRRRTAFCEWLINDVLGNPRTVRLLATDGDPNSGLWPESAEAVVACDFVRLDQTKLFYAELTITYREIAAA